MTMILGLTGSIGMGKSTTASFFREAGVPVWDADATVHRLYSPGQPAARAIAAEFPEAISSDGAVNRDILRSLIARDRNVMDRLNMIVHPLVADERSRFLRDNVNAPLVVLDIPLLFETGGDRYCDETLVVTAPSDIQRQRVLARGLTAAEFQAILDRQMPDTEKRKRATHVLETLTFEETRKAVQSLIQTLSKTGRDA